MNRFWVFFWGLLIGVVVGFTLSVGYTYYAVGTIALFGGIIQGAMRRQAKKALDISPEKPHTSAGSKTRNPYGNYHEENK